MHDSGRTRPCIRENSQSDCAHTREYLLHSVLFTRFDVRVKLRPYVGGRHLFATAVGLASISNRFSLFNAYVVRWSESLTVTPLCHIVWSDGGIHRRYIVPRSSTSTKLYAALFVNDVASFSIVDGNNKLFRIAASLLVASTISYTNMTLITMTCTPPLCPEAVRASVAKSAKWLFMRSI